MDITHYSLDACNALLRLRRERRISWRAVGLGLAIASFATRDIGEAWPSRTTLRAITGIEESDISRVVHELEDSGFLAVEVRDGQSNIYRLTHGQIATGGKTPMGKIATHPWGKRTKTRGRLATHNNEEQYKNNETLREEEKSPSGKPNDEGERKANLLLPCEPPQPSAKSVSKSKKNAAPEIAEAAERLVALYGSMVKPKRLDKSGSRKVFLATATRLLASGNSEDDLTRAIRNYAATAAQGERGPDDVKYRYGLQTFFGPKNEHWRDHLDADQGEAAPLERVAKSDMAYLDHFSEMILTSHGRREAETFRAKAFELGSVSGARRWFAETHKEACHA